MKVTREELFQVLKGDNTLEQIEEAIANGELTQEEWGRIADYLREDDIKKADQMFEEIMQDIDSKPAYDDAKSEIKGWKEYRAEVAQEIHKINTERRECEQEIKTLQSDLDYIEETFGDVKLSESEQTYFDKIKESKETEIGERMKDYDELTKRHSALALMHTEARSQEAQAYGRLFLEQTAPVREGLGYIGAGIKLRINDTREQLKEIGEQVLEKTKDIGRGAIGLGVAAIDKVKELGENIELHRQEKAIQRQQNKATREMANSADDLSFHPLQNIYVKSQLSKAMNDIKDMNYWKEKADKEEQKIHEAQQKMIKKAQQIADKEVKPTFLEKLEAWSKKEKVTPKEAERVTDLDRAKEILLASGKYKEEDLELKNLTDNLEKFNERADKAESKALEHTERVAEIMRDRQEEVKEFQQDFDTKKEMGELNNQQSQLDEIQQGIDFAEQSSFLDGQSLDQDLAQFMQDHDQGDVIDFER